jgi:trehalose-phosphatase
LSAIQRESLAAAWAVVERSRLELRCERKPASVALHWRGLPEIEASRLEEQIRREWESISTGQSLELHPFDGGLELRAAGRTKATAVNEILAEMKNGQVAAFLGDDLTDEDGFRAIRGRGLGVLVRHEYRPTAADVHLVPPGELLGFLESWLQLAPRQKGC